ncbi:5'-3' exonuclease [Virgibacillus pantothenticus]|uniref:5'-3' exonuclease n=1 Tax=Virgibacillus pantothenticus TaxID=1473 RepID=A0A0L0QPZ4_VIRPA|nr:MULTISPECIES: 5'-3' exonuclease H3TH domain-containing protein [Virgibacillus]API94046.1 flap endonuclease [Virgibacillus sp. 6R]KNE20298.1 5'-3' exonuclease [Virgibacillus pantothenticus]MEB5453079.1 5'-3' exonuclease H3TH domain-containing protein [Virgibacillus pantothenticus]MEB5457327.1 5'-3' exonuclease H3TH domain-containing protein [Virgibacillus pantothenticus]MEB5461299.1 5'-3' exonuclease H3TH domain-containing protein [Virgibacillus pantothenticus]
MNKHQIMLVDGMALLFRGFFATAFRGNFMKTREGMPTNGVYQFLRYFLDAVNTFQPTHVVCCWDMGSKTFRTEMYAAYKANRDEPPVELIPQFDLAKKVVDSFNMPNIGLENYEADDCIGTLAKMYGADHEVTILTGDQDILQLVDDGIQVAIMKKGQGNYDLFNQANFYEKKGIHPKQIIDLKGLMGDPSDNYPGVKGIGEKTALKLIQEHGTIEDMIANIDTLPKGVQTKIKANMEMLHLSRRLAEIKCDVPITCELEQALWDYDRERIIGTFQSLEWKYLDKLV